MITGRCNRKKLSEPPKHEENAFVALRRRAWRCIYEEHQASLLLIILSELTNSVGRLICAGATCKHELLQM